jgi:hypothetical protein
LKRLRKNVNISPPKNALNAGLDLYLSMTCKLDLNYTL